MTNKTKNVILAFICIIVLMLPIFVSVGIEQLRENVIFETENDMLKWKPISVAPLNEAHYNYTNPTQTLEFYETNPNGFYRHTNAIQKGSMQYLAYPKGNNNYYILPNYSLTGGGKHLGISINITTFQLNKDYYGINIFSDNPDNVPRLAWQIWDSTGGSYIIYNTYGEFTPNNYRFTIDFVTYDNWIKNWNNTQLFVFYYITLPSVNSWNISVSGLSQFNYTQSESFYRLIYWGSILIVDFILLTVIILNTKPINILKSNSRGKRK